MATMISWTFVVGWRTDSASVEVTYGGSQAPGDRSQQTLSRDCSTGRESSFTVMHEVVAELKLGV